MLHSLCLFLVVCDPFALTFCQFEVSLFISLWLFVCLCGPSSHLIQRFWSRGPVAGAWGHIPWSMMIVKKHISSVPEGTYYLWCQCLWHKSTHTSLMSDMYKCVRMPQMFLRDKTCYCCWQIDQRLPSPCAALNDQHRASSSADALTAHD